MKFFAFLVCTFHKEPIFSDFWFLISQNLLRILKSGKSGSLVKVLQNNVNLTKIVLPQPYDCLKKEVKNKSSYNI